ncbi:MAG: hypothetical protein IPJ71_13730 [Bdellovibrionales bacterium]|nr:hypothetical protein [Bdellovibrionales bacterium]
MNRSIFCCLMAFPLFTMNAAANSETTAVKNENVTDRSPSSRSGAAMTAESKNRQELVEALKLVKVGRFQEASIKLFQLSHNPRFRDRKNAGKIFAGSHAIPNENATNCGVSIYQRNQGRK